MKIRFITILFIGLILSLSVFSPAKAETKITGIKTSVYEANKNSVNVSWDKVTGANTYEIKLDGEPVSKSNGPGGDLLNVSTGSHRIIITAKDSSGRDLATSGELTINKTDTTAAIGGTAVTPVPAVSPPAPDVDNITLPTSRFNTPRELVVGIINWLLSFVGILAVIAIFYSGVMYLNAGSDTAKAEAAKKNLVWAIAGVMITVSSLLIVNIIVNELNSI
jgi:hypothetical protein